MTVRARVSLGALGLGYDQQAPARAFEARTDIIVIDGGSISFLWERPLTLGIMLVTLVVLVAPLIQGFRQRRAIAQAGEGG